MKTPALICSFALLLVVGCGTSFKYTPTHTSAYGRQIDRGGIALAHGQDLRPTDQREPAWAEDAENIAARATATELRNSKLFSRVKIHDDSPNPRKFSTQVDFRVNKFQCANHAAFFESA